MKEVVIQKIYGGLSLFANSPAALLTSRLKSGFRRNYRKMCTAQADA